MADVHEDQEPHSVQEQEQPQDSKLKDIKRRLEVYRELLLPLNKVLEWDQSHYPGILIGLITVVFAFIWYLEPSVLTTFSLLGVFTCALDFGVPTLSAYFFKAQEWTVKEERQYETICNRLLHAHHHVENFKASLMSLRQEKPKAYLLIMMGAFASLAWIGSLIDNLLLTYILVIFAVLVPGLRKHGLLQKMSKTFLDLLTQVLNKTKEAKLKKN